jgi:hypothetical protein
MMFSLVPESSSYLLSVLFGSLLNTEVDDARDDSWRGSFTNRLYLAAKPSHVEVDVDGLAYPLHRPMTHSCQVRGHDLSTRRCPVLSLQ